LSFLNKNTFLFKLLNWEYWPWEVIYIPIILYYLWLSLKSRTLFFFFNVNPGIEGGGLLIESKKKILDLLPDKLIPKSLYFEHPVSQDEVLEGMSLHSIHFPVIIKPDYGERGWMVEKIEDSYELDKYLKINRLNIIVQEFISYPIELGIFYVRHPDEDQGHITSIVKKKLLYVTGDGIANVRDLIKRNPRARIQLKRIEIRHPDLLNYIPDSGEKIELVPIANHARGAIFIDGNDLINPQLSHVVDNIGKNIKGFYYGRFDIRCKNIEDLNKGINFRILELNGAKSEPAHIYQPGYSLGKAYKVMLYHWKEMYYIARINLKNGIPFPSFSEGWAVWKKYRYYSRMRHQ